jgi:hypothetical protein
MHPRSRLPRKSWRLEHNQCHSLFLFLGVCTSLDFPCWLPQSLLEPRFPFSTAIVNKLFNGDWACPIRAPLTTLYKD